jgi:4-hydroxybenzoate polyprenyltransferase
MLMEPRKPMPAWVVPTLVAAFGLLTFAAFWIGGRPQLGAVWALVNVAFALAIAIGSRSDTVRLLRGAEDDERTMLLELQASTFTAIVLVLALTALFLAAGIRGESGLVYAVLLLAAEATHVASLFLLNRKS